MITKIYSKIDSSKLLHIIAKVEDFQNRVDVAPEDQFLQMAKIKLPKGKMFRPHQHIWKSPSYGKTIAQESWVIIRGSVKIYYYDTDGTLLLTDLFSVGDVSMTFEGGHKYEIMEDDTLVYEFKTGPYCGIENDKTFIEE